MSYIRTYRTPKGTELYLQEIKGKEYLGVPERVRWFREEHPLGRIDTECIVRHDKFVIYRATISVLDPARAGEWLKLSDAVKREDYSHFADAEEKAQTSAIGRALALCGFGTAFCADELSERDRVVDAPHGTKVITAPGPDGNGIQSIIVPKQIEPGDYVIAIGKKFKGMKIRQVPAHELEQYIDWLEENASKKGLPISSEARELKVQFGRFMNDGSDLDSALNSIQEPPWPESEHAGDRP